MSDLGDMLAAAFAAPTETDRRPPHDHTDKRVFGFHDGGYAVRQKDKAGNETGERRIVEHKEPIPAYYFTCPRCGGGGLAQYLVSMWTPLGMEWMKGTFPDWGKRREMNTQESF